MASHRCKNRQVMAVVVTTDGEIIVGRNDVENPQEVCPRIQNDCKSGEGYEHCVNVCCQKGHAEIVALEKAGEKAKGSTLYLIGHDYACDGCKLAMARAGVANFVIPQKHGMQFYGKVPDAN